MYVNATSPFARLSAALFSPTATATAAGRAASSVASQSDPFALAAKMPINSGAARNPWSVVSGLGEASAARSAAPLAQKIDDARQNAQWALSRSNANEQYANSAFRFGAENQRHNPMAPLISQLLSGILS